MKIFRGYDLLSPEHRSCVDAVRRRSAPPYARRAIRTNWAAPGGLTWTFVWIRISFFLWIAGLTLGFAFGPQYGIEYDPPRLRVSTVVVERLVSGQPIRGTGGQVLVDPALESVISAMDRTASAKLGPVTPDVRIWLAEAQ